MEFELPSRADLLRVKILERKLAIGFASVVTLLLLVAGGAAWEAARFHGTYDSMRETYEVFVRLDRVLTGMLGMEASVRGYSLSGDPVALRPHEMMSPQFEESLRDLKQLSLTHPELRAKLDELEPLAASIRESMARRIAARREGTFDSAAQIAATLEGQRTLVECWRLVRAMAEEQRQSINERIKHAYELGQVTNYASIGASALAILCVAVAGVRAVRALSRRQDAEAALRESFARVEDLYHKAPCGYHSLDASGKIVAMNDTALNWLGYTREEVIGRMRFIDLLAPESAAVFPDRFALFQRKGSVHNVEYDWKRKDGSIFPTLLNATAVYDAQGNYLSSRATVYDVSKRRRAEAERDRFFTVARDLLCIANFEGRFTRLNPAWQRVLGYTDEELLATPFIEFVHPEDRERTAEETARLAAGDEAIEFENRYRTKQGDYRWLRWNARSIRSEQLIYASARDVTDSKEVEARIQHLNTDLATRAQQLEAANRELESFSYSVSHDLRAPLRHVDGFASLLTKHSAGTLDEESRRYVATISKAAKQMGVLIDDLLAFSRIGRAPLRQEPVNHDQLVASVMENGRFATTHPKIVWEIAPLPNVRADAAMLRQVWTNLIDNAVKYSGKNPNPCVAIGTSPSATSSEYVFFVRDNGVGFNMAYADKLFGVFQRLHGPTEFEGTGIGLANVRRIVARHGGRTWAEARVDEGAVFYFSLPQPNPVPGTST